MTIEWEAKDIYAGRRVWTDTTASNSEKIISYIRNSRFAQGNLYGLVDLQDGLNTTGYVSRTALAQHLTHMNAQTGPRSHADEKNILDAIRREEGTAQ